MTTKSLKVILGLIFLLVLVGLAYWQFFVRSGVDVTTTTSSGQNSGFVPLGRNVPARTNTGSGSNASSSPFSSVPGTVLKVPALRLLSDTPVSGYGASTTEPVSGKNATSTTFIRWLDRGRGDVYETNNRTLAVTTISNTIVPKMYETLWNKNLTSFMAFGISSSDEISGIWAELRSRTIAKTGSSTPPNNSSLTPYELRGKSLPEHILAYAVSPKHDKVLIVIRENERGVGYVFRFDGTSPVKLFSTPLTQISAEWPEEQTVAVTTKGAADERGYLYFINTKTGSWKKILGPVPGLSARVSTDAKHVFISAAGSADNIVSLIYDVSKRTSVNAVIHTLADKCVWGNFYKDLVYCAVPAQQIPGTYPDDWYRGDVSFSDKLWQINASSQEVRLVSTIVDASDRIIDIFNLGLDPKDNFLIFMNKNDLSLWSLDLTKK